MPEQLRSKLTGPVYPILPAFCKNGDLDAEATGKYVQYLVANGARILMVTAGTSRLNLLSVAEVMQLNSIVAKQAGEQAITIAANPDYGSLAVSIEIAIEAKDAGASAFLLYYSERYYDDEAVFDYFSAVATACSLPLLIHAMPMRGASTGPAAVHPFGVELVRRLATIPALIGMKEENGNEGLRQRLALEFGERLAIIAAGGGMGKYLSCQALGIPAYLTGLGNLNPALEQNFYDLCQQGKFAQAGEIVRRLEQPFFDVAVPIGWHVALKGAMDHLGLMPIYERAPLRPPTPDQLEKLSAIISQLGLETA